MHCKRFLRSVLVFGLLFSLIQIPAAETFGQEKTKDSDKKKKALPLEPGRHISYTTNEVTWMSIDVSPDGKTLVLEIMGDLYLLPVSGGKAERITSGMALDTQPRFSPDGKQIVFVSDRGGSENVWILETGKTIVDTTETSKENGLRQLTKGKGGEYCSPEWTPDGNYVIVSKAHGFTLYQFRMIHVEGGSGMKLMQKEENKNALGAAFGGGERFIYFSSKQGRFGYNLTSFNWQIERYDRETGESFRLTGEVGGGIRPALSGDGRWMVYASRHDAETGFRLRDMNSGTEKWLTFPIQRDDMESAFTRDLLPGYTFLPDNSAIIAAIDGKLVRISVPGGERTEIPFEADIALDLGPLVHFDNKVETGPVEVRQIRWPSVSPDGKKLLFTAMHKIYTKDTGRGQPERLVEMDTGQYMPVWSPDGKWAAFVTWSEESGGYLYKVAANGSNLQRLNEVSAYYTDPVWTPDGKEVIVARGPWQQRQDLSYFNNIRGQGLDLVRIPADGGEAVFMAPFRGVRPHFSNDPERLFVYERRNGLVSMKLDGTDRKIHLKVTGFKPPTGPGQPGPASEIVMGQDGEHALALVNNHIYLVTVPMIGGEVPTISVLNPESATFPVKRLTKYGGFFMNWVSGGEEIIWSLGKTLFRYNRTEAAQFERELSEKAEDKEEGEEKEPGYEPAMQEIQLELPRQKGSGTLVLRGAKILTMDPGLPADGVIDNGAVVIEDDRITAVGQNSSIETPRGAREIDVSGKIILPGYVDTHAHMWPAWGVHRGVVWEYLANLAYGVITTRDPQTSTTDILTYSDLVETGEMVGPRIFHTGPGIFISEPIKNLEDARNVLKRYSEFFKIWNIKEYVSGDRDVRQWIIQAAREYGSMPTTEGGLDMKLDFTQVVDGYPGHEHTFPIAPLYKDFVELVARSKTFYTPTLIVTYGGPWSENDFYVNTNVHDNTKLRRFTPHNELDKLTRRRQWFHEEEHAYKLYAAQAKKVIDTGGTVCVGGHGQLQGLGYHWELWSVQSGGMTEMEALRCATLYGARAIGFPSDLGSLEAGKLADLQILEKDPLENIRNSTSIRYVIKNGLMYDAESLDMLWPVEKKLPKPYWWGVDPVKNKR